MFVNSDKRRYCLISRISSLANDSLSLCDSSFQCSRKNCQVERHAFWAPLMACGYVSILCLDKTRLHAYFQSQLNDEAIIHAPYSYVFNQVPSSIPHS